MNDIWHFLREFESKDIVKRFYKRKFNYELNTAKAVEINCAFTQGREYFNSSAKADLSVRPLLQYYGVVALSRGLILMLNRNARENNIIPSHGLKIKNWSDVEKSGKIDEVILKISNGTFFELIKATENRSFFRVGSSGINWNVGFPLPSLESEFYFGELAFCFPDLKDSVEAWLNETFPCRMFKNSNVNGNEWKLEIHGENDPLILSKIFPLEKFYDLEIIEANKDCIIKFDKHTWPNLCQKWSSTFTVIGDLYVVPPLSNDIYLNELSKMYSTSFILGTISRYHPSTWNNINKGISNDAVLPFLLNFMDFLQEKFPQSILEFLQSLKDYKEEN